MLARGAGVAGDDDFAKIAEILERNGLELPEKSFANDSHAGAGVIENVFAVVRFGLGVDGNGDRADFDGAEEGVEEFRRVEKQEEHALFGANAEIAKRVAGAVGALEELLVGDSFVAAFDGDIVRAALENIAIHEIRGGVEELRQSDHVAAMFIAPLRRKSESERPCMDDWLIVYAVSDSSRQFGRVRH